MKAIQLLSPILIMSILITSCKKTSSSNSSNQSINQSTLYGKWNVVSDSSIVIQSSSSPFPTPTSYDISIGLTPGGDQYQTFLQNGQYIDAGPVGGYSAPFSDTTTWKFINNNQLVIGTANYFNGILEDTQDSVTIIHLDAHNLNYKSIVHEYNSPDSIYIDYINLNR